MRSTDSTALRRVLVVFLAVFFVVTLGVPGVGVAKKNMVAGSGMAEGDPGDGHDSSGGSGGSIGELGGSGASTRPDSSDDDVEASSTYTIEIKNIIETRITYITNRLLCVFIS